MRSAISTSSAQTAAGQTYIKDGLIKYVYIATGMLGCVAVL